MSVKRDPDEVISEILHILFDIRRLVSEKIPPNYFPENRLERVVSEISSYLEDVGRKKKYSANKLNSLLNEVQIFLEYYEAFLQNGVKDSNGNIFDELFWKLSDLGARLDELKSIISLKEAEFNENKSIAEVENRLVVLDNRIFELDAKFIAVEKDLKAFSANMAMAQIAANESSGEFIENQKIIFKEELDKLMSYLESKRASIKDNEDKINSVISVLASKALSGSFMRNALKEEKAANTYRRNAIILMSGVGAFLLLNFIGFEFDLVTHEAWINRIVIGLFFSFVVGYLIRQSAVHRNQQFMYQQKALDLNALSPYVAGLPDEMQHKIKHQMAERLFVAPGGSTSQDTQTFGAQEILGKLLDKLDFPKAPR